MTESVNLAGVIGYPIAHSRSPVLHAHWLARYGIKGHYVPLLVNSADLRQTLELLPRLGFRGVNVTLPHKEAVLEIADFVTDNASLIGAANTLTFTADGRIQADNTDGSGFLENVRHGAPAWVPGAGPAMVLGAGGAARAVITALLGAGVPKVKVTNRTKGRAEALRAHFGAQIEVIDWVKASESLNGINILINTTSLGMTGKPELKISLDHLPPNATVTDIVYAPLRTELLKQAERKGHVTVDGLGMLLHQAAPGFERWFDRRPEVDEALRQAVLNA